MFMLRQAQHERILTGLIIIYRSSSVCAEPDEVSSDVGGTDPRVKHAGRTPDDEIEMCRHGYCRVAPVTEQCCGQPYGKAQMFQRVGKGKAFKLCVELLYTLIHHADTFSAVMAVGRRHCTAALGTGGELAVMAKKRRVARLLC